MVHPATDEAATLDALGFGDTAVGSEAFLIVYIDAQSKVIALPDGVDITIGRSRTSTIYLDDERISRHHARIERRGASVFVVDLGSRNGTRLRGEPVVDRQQVRGGDTITVGPLTVVVAVAAATGAAVQSLSDLGQSVIADPGMAQVYELCRRVAVTEMPVLVTGETGVGKERVAEAIHGASPRSAGPLVRLHVAALPESLVESELFGHERGAFTGADRRHRGYFESASGGTLFLDEIGELGLTTQAKLLRVLESHKIIRLGSTEEIPVDVRVVAATNRDLDAAAKAGRFREDLFFRLAGFRIDVPPLRARPSEIPLLAALFAREMARASKHPTAGISPEAMAVLTGYRWPGNVRELKHVIESACVMATPGDIGFAHLPPALRTAPAAPASSESGRIPLATGGLTGSVDRLEREAIVAALRETDGNQTRAAQRLGISRRTLLYKMQKLQVRSTRAVE